MSAIIAKRASPLSKYTLTHEICKNTTYDQIELMLKNGADPNWPDLNNNSPLHHAAWKKSFDITSLLLRHGAKPNNINRDKSTPLHVAARLGERDIVNILLKYGADPDITMKGNITPLMIAVETRDIGILSELMKYDADPTLINEEGRNALSILRFSGYPMLGQHLLRAYVRNFPRVTEVKRLRKDKNSFFHEKYLCYDAFRLIIDYLKFV